MTRQDTQWWTFCPIGGWRFAHIWGKTHIFRWKCNVALFIRYHILYQENLSIWRIWLAFIYRSISKSSIQWLLKPRSHIACNRSATSLRPTFRVVAGRLQGGCKEVGDRSPTGCRRLQGRFGRKEVLVLQVKPLCDQIDRRKVFGRRRQVADRSPTGWRLIADQLQRLQTIPTQFLVADWSPTNRRSVADRSPKSCRLSAIEKKRSRYSHQPVADRSPIGCRSLPNWSPTDCRLIAGNYCWKLLYLLYGAYI